MQIHRNNKIVNISSIDLKCRKMFSSTFRFIGGNYGMMIFDCGMRLIDIIFRILFFIYTYLLFIYREAHEIGYFSDNGRNYVFKFVSFQIINLDMIITFINFEVLLQYSEGKYLKYDSSHLFFKVSIFYV